MRDHPGMTDLVARLPVRRLPRPSAAVLLVALVVFAAMLADSLSGQGGDPFGGAVWSFDDSGRRLSVSQAQAIELGTARADLLALLGPPAGRGVQRMSGEPDLPCLLYRDVRSYSSRTGHNAFCFRDGRLAALRLW